MKLKLGVVGFILFSVLVTFTIFNNVFTNTENKDVIKVLSVHKMGDQKKTTYIDNVKTIYPDKEVNIDHAINEDMEIKNEKDLLSKIINKLKENKYHTIVGLNEANAYSLSKKNHLLNIDKYVNDIVDNHKILEGYWESIPNSNSNNAYFLPLDFKGFSLIYNEEIFKNLEIETPNGSESWEEIYNISNQIKNKSQNEFTPLTYGGKFPPMAFNDFKDYIAPLDINLENGGDELKNLWVSFINNYQKSSMKVYDGGEFLRGNVAMDWVDTGILFNTMNEKKNGNFLGAEEFNYNVVSSPTINGRSGYGKVNNVIAIPANTPEANISEGMLEVFYQDKFTNKFYNAGNTNIPIHTTNQYKDSYYNVDKVSLEDLHPEELNFSYSNYPRNIEFKGTVLMYKSLRGRISPLESYEKFNSNIKNTNQN